MLISYLLEAVNQRLNDPNDAKYAAAHKIQAVNLALQSLVSYRPDAAAHTAMVLLVAGTRQTLPADGVRLLKVIRNRGMNGLSVAGRAITKSDMLVMDALMPQWHEETGQTVVQEYFYDPLVPREFYVYPPAPVTPQIGIEISYVRVLPFMTAGTDTFPVDDYFAPAVIEWMLYAILSSDDEQSPSYSAATAHAAMFFQLLQVKVSSDGASLPKAVSTS